MISSSVGGNVTVSWYKDDELIPADDTDFKQMFDGRVARLNISATYLDDAATYRCVAATDRQQQASTTATLTVNEESSCDSGSSSDDEDTEQCTTPHDNHTSNHTSPTCQPTVQSPQLTSNKNSPASSEHTTDNHFTFPPPQNHILHDSPHYVKQLSSECNLASIVRASNTVGSTPSTPPAHHSQGKPVLLRSVSECLPTVTSCTLVSPWQQSQHTATTAPSGTSAQPTCNGFITAVSALQPQEATVVDCSHHTTATIVALNDDSLADFDNIEKISDEETLHSLVLLTYLLYWFCT
jgi:hypothetical protein